MPDPRCIFVYGSLMHGCELHRFMDGGEQIGAGSTPGALVSLGRYPALVDEPGTVRGELYRFADLPNALDILDDIEEYDATEPERSLYLRVACRVTLDAGGDVDAWVYVYNRDATGLPRIANGDWRKT